MTIAFDHYKQDPNTIELTEKEEEKEKKEDEEGGDDEPSTEDDEEDEKPKAKDENEEQPMTIIPTEEVLDYQACIDNKTPELRENWCADKFSG